MGARMAKKVWGCFLREEKRHRPLTVDRAARCLRARMVKWHCREERLMFRRFWIEEMVPAIVRDARDEGRARA
jgi:hypothetical protein